MWRFVWTAALALGLTLAPVGAQMGAPGGVVRVNGTAAPGLTFLRQNGDVLLPVEALGQALGKPLTADPAGHFVFLHGQAHKVSGVVVGSTVYVPWWGLQPLLTGYSLDIEGQTVDIRLGSTAASPAMAPPTAPSNLTAILAELNLARTNPQAYAQILESRRDWYVLPDNVVSRPGERQYRSKEGKAALEDAIAFLHRQSPLSPLTLSPGMSRAASDFVATNGPTGVRTHQGPDGSLPADRVARYGNWLGSMGENLDYGWSNARDIVADLIIDDGVPDRGHRANVFEPAFHVVGIAIGPNRVSRVMCVIDFAADYHEK